MEFATFPDRPEWNGIIESYDVLHRNLLNSKDPHIDDRVSTPAEVIKVPCKMWNNLDLPSKIDYLQIDVEGAEIKILSCIDWQKTHISYICLEDNNAETGEYKKFMAERGYTLIAQQHVDYLYFKPL